MIDFQKRDARFVRSTKSLVDELLLMNTNNRSIKKTHTQWIVEALRRNEFVATGQGICVSKTGKLIDGQHRLLAIKEAGYPPVDLLLVTGLEEKAMVYIDQNAKRTTSDMLRIVLNKTISHKMSAVINFDLSLVERKDGFFRGTKKPDLDRVVENMAENGELIAEICRTGTRIMKAGTVAAIFHYAKRYNYESALEFANKVGSGENLTRENPAYKLRERLLLHKSAGGYAALEDYKFAVTACKADANNEDIAIFRPSSDWSGMPQTKAVYYVSKDGEKKRIK